MAEGTAPAIWWIYLLAGAVTVIFTATVVGVIVLAQRRQVEQSQRFSQGLVEAQEAERARIARELHDDIIQRIALIGGEVSELGRVLTDPTPAVTQRLEGLREELLDLADEVRSMARRAHPSILDHLGLVKALQSLAGEMQISDGLDVTLELGLDESQNGVPSQAALPLYRVAQEGLRNVARHAGTGAAVLRAGRRQGGVFVEVEDRGVGMTQGSREDRGLGLLGLSERLRAVRGQLLLDSEPGRGTRLTAWVPERSRQ